MLFALQVLPEGQVPQFTVPLHPSETVPHTSPAGQLVWGVQMHWPLLLQVFGAVHVPQFTVPPQPSGCVPHA